MLENQLGGGAGANAIFSEADRIAMKSGHGIGTSTTLAWAGWVFLICYENSRVEGTAPTFHQLEGVLWPEYAKWHAKMPLTLREQWVISEDYIRHKEAPKLWFATARTSNKPANLQGFHNEFLLIQADEASGIPENVFEVMEGALSGAEEYRAEGKESVQKLIMAGNPNFGAGEFFNAFHKNRDVYTRFTISGDPNIHKILKSEEGMYLPDHGKVYFSKRVKQKYRDTMAKKYGTEGPIYDIRVRGLFSKSEDDAIIPLAWAQAAATRGEPQYDKIGGRVTLVMDVSRGGSAEKVLGAIRKGTLVNMKAWARTTTTQCEDYVIEERDSWHRRGIEVERIIIDEPGVGGGVIDGLRRRNVAITAYNGGESMKEDIDPSEDCRMFANRRARDYWHARRLFEQGLVSIPDDEELINQLALLKYFYSEREKIQVESKRKLKDRLGSENANCDRADMFVMGLAPWYSFKAPISTVRDEDIVMGEDRPALESELM